MNGALAGNALSIEFSPLLPSAQMGLVLAAGILLFLLSAAFVRRGVVLRALVLAVFLLLFLNPSVVREKREPVNDVMAVVVDRSPSQQFGARMERTDKALAALRQNLANLPTLDVRVIETPAPGEGIATETRLFGALEQALADVPAARRAGVILLTDGQVQDAPAAGSAFGASYGPVHAFLTGARDEKDRQIVVTEAPAYGIVGQDVVVRFRVEDTDTIGENRATIVIRDQSQAPQTIQVPVNEEQAYSFHVEHAGQNILEIEAAAIPGEITQANNKAPIIVNGVRDRLKVLLVSGVPHTGERTWRNILSSDPGVDLVHFTILREPAKLDLTPQNELSLIAFPVEELFEQKLYDFDLIIFDRYQLNNILPYYYFANIARYIREGGAFLEVSGPAFADQQRSVYNTALSEVLPAAPTGEIDNRAFIPQITASGKRHPVTRDLPTAENSAAETGPWGPWLRRIGVAPSRGDVLMSDEQGNPLLILSRVGEGRVAQLASDQIWLWSRGYAGGGPHAELIRRLGHWLMKEPELEENALNVRAEGRQLYIEKRAIDDQPVSVTVTDPEGGQLHYDLAPAGDGIFSGRAPAEKLGIYSVDDGTQKRFAVIGDINPPEFRAVVTTASRLKAVSAESKGTILWLEDHAAPEIRQLPPGRKYGGRGWAALRTNGAYDVSGVEERPLLPPWAYGSALIALIVLLWWQEARPPFKNRRSAGRSAERRG